MGTFLGLLSAGIAIALKDPLVNMVAWGFILIRQPFKVGDRIQIGKVSGDVIDIRLFQFSIIEIGNWVDAEQSTGRIIHIPNGVVFTEPQANYTAEFQYIWNEIPVLITFESDWKKAKQILTDIINHHGVMLSNEAEKQLIEAAKKFLIFYSKLTPIVYTSVKDSGVMLTLRYMCNPRERRSIEEKIWEDILIEFAKHTDIDFAYPTQRFYNNSTEGKAGTKPST
jgi:small-conductance mechanosensitive channel